MAMVTFVVTGPIPLTVKEGDRVIFSSYAGDEIKIGDEEYLLLRESDILAIY